jgi:uncharacterized protein YjbI with pentapeptide repeats
MVERCSNWVEILERRLSLSKRSPQLERLVSNLSIKGRKIVSDDVVIELTPPETAERAAWMLKGEYLGEGKVSVPQENANELTVNSVASILTATWQEVEDEQSSDRSEESERNRDLSLSMLQERVEALLDRQAESNRSLEESQRFVAQHLDERSSTQQHFDKLVERGSIFVQRENFAGIDASNRTFKNCNFNQSDLRDANFENTRLSGCTFEEANLAGANFKNAQMPGAILSSAVLSEANFEGANLCAAQLDWTNLRDAILCQANLQKASLESSNLFKADCSETDFTEANLSGAKLQQATCIASWFTRANLTHANLSFANLTVARFKKAQLGYANLEGSKGFNHKDHKDAFYQLTKISMFSTYSTRKPIIETLDNWSNLITNILAVGVFAGAVVYGALYVARKDFSITEKNQGKSLLQSGSRPLSAKPKRRTKPISPSSQKSQP